MMLMFSSVLKKIVVRSDHAWCQIKANNILNQFIQKSVAYQLQQTSIICPYSWKKAFQFVLIEPLTFLSAIQLSRFAPLYYARSK